MKRPLLVAGGVIVSGGLAWLAYEWLFGDVRALKAHAPDAPAAPGSSGYRRVDALLPKLRGIADAAGIPLGLAVAWVALESGGKLAVHPQPGAGDTSMDERGFWQLTPAESKRFGLDHARLSTDPDYSLNAGIPMLRAYAAEAADLGVAAAPAGSSFRALLVKLIHTVGGGQAKKWVRAAQAAGAMDSWAAFDSFVRGKSWTGPQPAKWMPFLGRVYALGRPFGFGAEAAPAVAGAPKRRGLLGIDALSARRPG